MGRITCGRLLICVVFVAFSLWLLSWETETYIKYCHAENDCNQYNLLEIGFIRLADFVERFQAFFIVIFTLAIALFTYQLKAATIGLDKSTRRLWRSGEKQIALAGGQLDLAQKQHGLQREEYFASHRPRLRLSRVKVEFTDGKPAAIRFALINSGEGKISEINWHAGGLVLREIGRMVGFYDFSKLEEHTIRFPAPNFLNIGEASLQSIEYPIDAAIQQRIIDGVMQLHLIGGVRYQDTLGVYRVMGFFRRYDSLRQRFVDGQDPEYEYQD